jgi:predicted ArsR family transcriptional regulator
MKRGFMKEKLRTENKSRFAKEYTDEEFIKAVCTCLNNATCSAAEVADIVGCSPRYAKDRLLQLAEQGEIQKKMKGNTWGFRPDKHD